MDLRVIHGKVLQVSWKLSFVAFVLWHKVLLGDIKGEQFVVDCVDNDGNQRTDLVSDLFNSFDISFAYYYWENNQVSKGKMPSTRLQANLPKSINLATYSKR